MSHQLQITRRTGEIVSDLQHRGDLPVEGDVLDVTLSEMPEMAAVIRTTQLAGPDFRIEAEEI